MKSLNLLLVIALEMLIHSFFHSASMLLLGRVSWDGAKIITQVVKVDCVYIMFK